MDERKPLWQLTEDELRAMRAAGCTEQERRTAETLLVNRAQQRNKPGRVLAAGTPLVDMSLPPR